MLSPFVSSDSLTPKKHSSFDFGGLGSLGVGPDTGTTPALIVFLVTEGRGSAGGQLCRTVAGQFPKKILVQVVGSITEERLPSCLQMMARYECIIAHTVVKTRIREKLVDLARSCPSFTRHFDPTSVALKRGDMNNEEAPH